MIVTTQDATAHILDTRSGEVLHAITLEADPQAWWGPVVIDTKNGNAYVTGATGTLVINVRNGHVLRRLSAHGSLIEIDQHLEHVFVATEGRAKKVSGVGALGLIHHWFSKDASNVYGSVTTIDADR